MRTATGFARETLEVLGDHDWPGNVRQLEHTIERAVALSASVLILPDDLPPEIRATTPVPHERPPGRLTLEEMKRWYVGWVLEESGGNKARAAEALGIDRRTLYRILERELEESE